MADRAALEAVVIDEFRTKDGTVTAAGLGTPSGQG